MSGDAAPLATAIVPARLEAQRFPNKPLKDDTGLPLIVHVVRRVEQAATIGRVVVATDAPAIADAVRGHGGEAVMTGQHPNGTSRVADAATRLGLPPDALVVNVQGDEPEVPPDTIDRLARGLAADPEAPMATLASPLAAGEDADDPNLVKVVVDQRGRAMLFSRSRIPFPRSTDTPPPLKHPGLYAYRRSFLDVYVGLPPTTGELAEKLEQLRVLEHGHPIRIIPAPAPHPGIDTPEQYAAFVERHRHAAKAGLQDDRISKDGPRGD